MMCDIDESKKTYVITLFEAGWTIPEIESMTLLSGEVIKKIILALG